MGKVTTLCLLLALTACTQTTRGSYCAIARPDRPTQAEIDAMSDERVKEMLVRNEVGANLCGWRP